MPPIRGEHAQVTVTYDGQPIAIFNCLSYQVNDASDLVKKNYLGKKLPTEARVEKGFTGSIVYEVEDGALDDLLDTQRELSENNQAQDLFGIQISKGFSDGQTIQHSYYPSTIKINENAGGREEWIQKTLEFSSSNRKKVS